MQDTIEANSDPPDHTAYFCDVCETTCTGIFEDPASDALTAEGKAEVYAKRESTIA